MFPNHQMSTFWVSETDFSVISPKKKSAPQLEMVRSAVGSPAPGAGAQGPKVVPHYWLVVQ